MDPISYAKVIGTTCQLAPSLSKTVVVTKKKICPIGARSCFDPYDKCCIPEHGRLVLAQQWIPENPENIFHIHGFWPGHCDGGRHPEGLCHKSPVGRDLDYLLNRQSKREFKGTMTRYWPTSEPGWTNSRFWAYQWNHHGVCLSTIQADCFDESNDDGAVERYLRLTLDQYYKYNVKQAFHRLEIDPGNTYHIHHINDALKNMPNYSLHCEDGKLTEIKFYLLGGSYNNFYPLPPASAGSCGNWIEFPRKVGDNTPSSSSEERVPRPSPLADNNSLNNIFKDL